MRRSVLIVERIGAEEPETFALQDWTLAREQALRLVRDVDVLQVALSWRGEDGQQKLHVRVNPLFGGSVAP